MEEDWEKHPWVFTKQDKEESLLKELVKITHTHTSALFSIVSLDPISS